MNMGVHSVSMSTPRRLLTARELAEALGVSYSHVQEWRRSGELPFIDVDRSGQRVYARYDLDEVLTYLRERMRSAEPTDEITAVLRKAKGVQ